MRRRIGHEPDDPWAHGPGADSAEVSTWIVHLAVHILQQATSPTVVTIQFDDGNANQYLARGTTSFSGMHATFYVNSGVIEDENHLTWSQLGVYYAGRRQRDPTTAHLRRAPNMREAEDRGPPGRRCAGVEREPVQPRVPAGFVRVSVLVGRRRVGGDGSGVWVGRWARRGSGVDGHHVLAEAIPPLDASRTRTPPNPKQSRALPPTIEGYVTAAAMNGGGWVRLVLHNICSGCDASVD